MRTRTLLPATLLSLAVGLSSASLQPASDSTPTMNQAMTHVQQGQWDEAIAALKAILKADATNAQAQFMLGYALHASGDLDNAILAHKKATKMPAVAPQAFYNLGCAYALQGKTNDAFEALQTAMDMGVRDTAQFKGDSDLKSLHSDERWSPMLKSIDQLTKAETALHFGVGEWECYSTTNGKLSGTNTLAFRVNKNVIHESWAGIGGQFSGESWNVYNRQTNEWEQTWVDTTGNRLFITAKCNDDSIDGLMFEGENIAPGSKPQKTRMHVRPIDNGRVMQTGFTSNDNGKTWTQSYEFVYVPKGEDYVFEAES